MVRPRKKGTAWETAIVSYLRAHGAPHAERRALGGARDRGDIAGLPGIVIEAKAATRVDLAGWLAEAEAERCNDHADIAIVWAKRVGKTSPDHGYIVTTPASLLRLLAAAGYLAADQEPS